MLNKYILRILITNSQSEEWLYFYIIFFWTNLLYNKICKKNILGKIIWKIRHPLSLSLSRFDWPMINWFFLLPISMHLPVMYTLCLCARVWKVKQAHDTVLCFTILNYSTSFDRSDVTKVIYLNKSSFSPFTFTFMNTLHASSTSQLIIRLYRIFTGMKENSPPESFSILLSLKN